MPLRAALVSLLIVLAAACGRDEDRAADRLLLQYVHRLRDETDAGVAERRALLAAVARQRARSDVAIAAQAACHDAYTKLVNAEEAIDRAEREVHRLLVLREPTGDAAADLSRAEEGLAAARAAMPACDAAAARLAIAVR